MNAEIEAVLGGKSPGCIVTGNCYEVTQTLPDGCIDCCVTSPPYWGLRNYGIPPVEWPEVTFSPMPSLPPMTIPAESSVHGLEKDIYAYVAHAVLIFREVRRVLADRGTLWLNLGDSYAQSGMGGNPAESPFRKQATNAGSLIKGRSAGNGLKPKDLCGIPWQVAFALQADGWTLRQDIIWQKPNPMPESVTDRCTKAHEYVFLFSKQPRYFWDSEAIKEEAPTDSYVKYSYGFTTTEGKTGNPHNDACYAAKATRQKDGQDRFRSLNGRNKRSVWTITTQGTPEAHFATFPQKLVEPMILAGCPREVCPACGKPRERILKKNRRATRPGTESKVHDVDAKSVVNRVHHETEVGNRDPERHTTETQTVGWTDCNCAPQHGKLCYRPGRVLDPFAGSGTVGYVAAKLKRDYLLIEMNPKYVIDIAVPRTQEAEVGLPVEEQRAGQMALFPSE